MNNYLVYKHTSPSGKSYIGITNDYDRRCNQHQNSSNRCSAFKSAIAKHGWDSFEHTILLTNITLEEAKNAEQSLIAEHNTLAPNGYNLTTGGEGRLLSEETRAKLSATRKGRPGRKGIPLRREVIEKRIQTNAKLPPRVVSPETKAKISAGNKGRPRTIEHLAKIRASTYHITYEEALQFFLDRL